jgi:hypothetical protein
MDFIQQIKGGIDLANTTDIDTSNKMGKRVNVTTREIEIKDESKLNSFHIEKHHEENEDSKKIIESIPASLPQTSSMTKFAKPSPLHCPVSTYPFMPLTKPYHRLLLFSYEPFILPLTNSQSSL